MLGNRGTGFKLGGGGANRNVDLFLKNLLYRFIIKLSQFTKLSFILHKS